MTTKPSERAMRLACKIDMSMGRMPSMTDEEIDAAAALIDAEFPPPAADEVERVARALCKAIGAPWSYDKMPAEIKGLWHFYATEALSATDQSRRVAKLERALKMIEMGTEDIVPPHRAMGTDQMKKIARAALNKGE